MAPRPLAVVPLKGFEFAKARLDLPPTARASLARAVAERVIASCDDAGFEPLVVTGSDSVRRWGTELGVRSIDEPPGAGLDAAAAMGVTDAAGRPWLVVHGDLPLLSAEDISGVDDLLVQGLVVIAASRDGGTNLLGSIGHFDFRYGVASFHRHLAAAAHSEVAVLSRAGTAIEIDTLLDLEAASRLPAGAWLRPFLS